MLELDYRTYLDKVHGGWIGKCIGGAIGALQENNKSLMDYTIDNVFPAVIPPNDDLDLQVLYLQEVLEKKGSRFTPTDIAEAFAKYNLCMANEYSIAIRNMELGIEPPYSGSFNNTFFQHSMGSPIRSEIWAFICPGEPGLAAEYAAMDAIVDHEAESVYGEQFYAALEASCFFESDLRALIERGLAHIPADSSLARCIRYVQSLRERESSWQAAREALISRFGSADASYSVVNIGITVLALLFGEGDYTDTLLIAVNCGYDTDCTAATAGAILGTISGASAIPRVWLDKIGEDVVIGTVAIARHSSKILELAKDTCTAGLSLARDGVTSIRYTEVPADAKPSLPLPAAAPMVELAVRYDGLPSVGRADGASVRLSLRNNSPHRQQGTLTLGLPAHLRASLASAELDIPAGGSVTLPVAVELAPGAAELPHRNRLTAAFAVNGMPLGSKTFGLSGARRMKLIGPFWDNYDTSVHASDPYEGKMPTSLQAMFNSYVHIDRPYIDESFRNLDELPGRYVDVHEDIIRADELVDYRGPCCIYLVHDFVCPVAREGVELLLGNEGAFKVWLNGENVSASDDVTTWMPYNHLTVVSLRASVNRMIVKLVRRNRASDFSVLMRSPESGMRLFTDQATLLEG